MQQIVRKERGAGHLQQLKLNRFVSNTIRLQILSITDFNDNNTNIDPIIQTAT
jgi:hypothetical protein